MSLFRSRDWWSTTCGSDEQFDNGCLCVANIDNASDGLVKIVVGSFSGLLRVFAPHAILHDNGSLGSPRTDNLLLEARLAEPILQVEAGKFVFSSENIHLAVLHPRKFSIYSISESPASVEYGSHHQLGLMYQHNLQRSAFRFTVGPFGKVKGRDFVCVLSLDGTLSFFEQESFTFSRFLPGALLPGPLAYNLRTDSFLVVSSSFHLEAFKYQVLAAASSSSSDHQDQQNIQTGKKVQVDWSYNLGEGALDVSLIHSKTNPTLIYILGERHLFCIKDTGALKFMKKLEFHPSSFHAYAHGIEGTVFVMITSHTGMMTLYQDVTLRWAMQLPFIPVQLCRINLRGLQGGILSLREDGQLACSYLGTNPTAYTPPAVVSRDINYVETDKELMELYKVINAAHKTGAPLAQQTNVPLTLCVTLADELDFSAPTESHTAIKMQSSNSPSITLKICLKLELPLDRIQVTCSFEDGFVVSEPLHHFYDISDDTTFTTKVQLSDGFVPSTLSGVFVAVCSNALGVPSVVQSSVQLPLKLCVSSYIPQKDADFKITINTNKSSFKLSDIFPEFVSSSDKTSSASQALGFQYYGGPTVTLLAAKSSSRYRLQSDCFGAMSILVQELLTRLQKLSLKVAGGESLVCSSSSLLPFQEFYCVVNKHLQNRQKSFAYEKRLSQLAAQFRVIQKRLLAKFKEKTTAPLNNLDMLLESTYRQILSTSDAMEAHQHVLKMSLCNLNASARLLTILMKMCSSLSDADFELVQNIMCPPVAEETNQGWEELVTAGLQHVLKTVLSHPNHEYVAHDHQLTMPEDIENLKKQISAVDSIMNKGTITEENESKPLENFGSLLKPSQSDSESEEEDNIPLGSQFGERRRQPSAPSYERPKLNEEGAADKTDVVQSPPHFMNPVTETDIIDDHLKDIDKLPDIHTIPFDESNQIEEF